MLILRLFLIASLFASVGHVFTLLTDGGGAMDPNGVTADEGVGIDPNGATACYSACLDPNG